MNTTESYNNSKHADLVKLSLFWNKKSDSFTKPVFEALYLIGSFARESSTKSRRENPSERF